jgi:hypothetical protein
MMTALPAVSLVTKHVDSKLTNIVTYQIEHAILVNYHKVAHCHRYPENEGEGNKDAERPARTGDDDRGAVGETYKGEHVPDPIRAAARVRMKIPRGRPFGNLPFPLRRHSVPVREKIRKRDRQPIQTMMRERGEKGKYAAKVASGGTVAALLISYCFFRLRG